VQVITVGLDIAKSWFQAHGVNDRRQVVLRKKLARS
jgi:transposase